MKYAIVALLLSFCVGLSGQRPNILIITADDMNWNTVGCFNGEQQAEGVTPNIDQLAADGIIFSNAHVASTACMPSRNAINTGRLPHRSGGEGFHDLRIKNIPTIPNVFNANGYFVGILGKVAHSTPYEGVTPWAIDEEMERNTDVFYDRVSTVIDSALNDVGKPFYLIVNSHDPHRPYYKLSSVGSTLSEKLSHPSKIFYPEDVIMPAWLPEDETVRTEMAEYLCSSRRCDDVVGKVLQVLDEQNIADNTLVFFLSDHGMAAPSIKSNIYYHSTKTPLIMRWNGSELVTPGTDINELVSVLDIFPTICEATGISIPEGLDGQSLLPHVRGEQQNGRKRLFTTYNTTIGKNIYAFRKVHNTQYAYIFNPWHDGRTTYNSSSLGASFFETMLNLGQTDSYWQERCDFILTRIPEEFYDVANDPDCLNNLIDDPGYADEIEAYRQYLLEEMQQSSDPILSVFNTYQSTGDVAQTYAEFVKVIADANWVGHAPNLVVVEDKWTIYPPDGTIYSEDFENTSYKYGVLGAVQVDIVANPLKAGINTSNTVLKVTRGADNTRNYIGTSAVVKEFDAPRYVHMKVLKSRASGTRFQLSKSDNSGKVITESMLAYDATQLNTWQDLVFDMGAEYSACGKVWIQVDYTSEVGPVDIYVDDILFNNDPNSREPVSTAITERMAQSVSLYPNPAREKIYIEGYDGSCAEVIDVNGKVCCSASDEAITRGIDVAMLPKGMYVLRLKMDEGYLVRKFLKR
ncbi:sulfatase-like hydrolase/transferase [Carboxylicivirga sediminis]|uniref:Sulfatase-like hydrolase/transferase n=1 Tax=Carboxylicivirga sediminis TaxID=2006564 RepID=A0A941IWK2_9BACT|nr:sulfatase-like hydrolase/transferase [Carboxylicivirga sediminis]MBR8534479.1 sulfatase-like hydrolase/transferase [Carboxylicivirga sediminis]